MTLCCGTMDSELKQKQIGKTVGREVKGIRLLFSSSASD